MSMHTGLWILCGLILLVGTSACVIYRPRNERKPKTLAVGPFWTGWVAFWASLTMGALMGTILGEVGYTIAVLIADDAMAAEYWGGVIFGVLFIIGTTCCAIPTWHNAFPETTVAVGHGGVLKFLKTRIYSLYLKEGSHRLPWFLTSQDVDMTVQIGKQLDFDEPTKDHATVGLHMFWEYRIALPARSLSTGSVTEKISPTFDKLSKTGARNYVCRYNTEELLENTPPLVGSDARHRDQIQRDVLAELLKFSRHFVDPDSLKLKVEELTPPKADIEAAGLARAAVRENERNMLLIDGFNARLTKIRTAHPELDAKGAAILLQTQESKLSRSAFIFEDLKGSVDKFTQGVGAFLRAIAESAADRAAKTGGTS